MNQNHKMDLTEQIGNNRCLPDNTALDCCGSTLHPPSEALNRRPISNKVCWLAISLFMALGNSLDLIYAAQIFTKTPLTQPISVSAGGDSAIQAITPDARFVLFVSAANNLVSDTNSFPAPEFLTPRLNIFRRDRQLRITKLISANLLGRPGNGDSAGADLATNGAIAVFESTASDMVSSDTNGLSDVFVRLIDTEQTLLVSVSTNGGAGNGESRSAVMTPDGRHVTFVSSANNLVANDTNGIADVFVRDLQLGTTRLVSVGATRSTSTFPTSTSTTPEITPDGRYVAFFSSATNLLPHVTTPNELYLRDLVADTTYWISTNARSLLFAQFGDTNGIFYNHALSADGRFIAFAGSLTIVSATNPAVILRYDRDTGVTELIHANGGGPRFSSRTGILEDHWSLDLSSDGRFIAFVANTNGTTITNGCVLLWDAQTLDLAPISVTTNGAIAANAQCSFPTVDASGRFVSFISTASDLVTNNTSGDFELYLRDIQTGTTTLVSAGTNDIGVGVGEMLSPARLSADGQTIAFESLANDLFANDLNQASDVFVRSLSNNITELVSIRATNLPARSASTIGSVYSLSENGRYLAFASEASDLVPYDTNGLRDVFVRDLVTDTIALVSVSTNGVSSANGASFEPSISGDGRYVAFTSWASNLVVGDNDVLRDVFVRDLLTGTTTNINTAPGATEFVGPQIDAVGKFLLFSIPNLFTPPALDPRLRNIPTGTVKIFPTSNTKPVMTPSGQFVAYLSSGRVVLWNTISNADVWASASLSSVPSIGISGNGRHVAYGTATNLIGADTQTSNTWAIANGIARTSPSLRFSMDGRFLAFVTTNSLVAADGNNLADVYLYDFETAQHQLISFNPSLGFANGASDSPDISADGRFIVFRSAASNLVMNDSNTAPDIFLFDRTTAMLSCLSRSQNGADPADNRSRSAMFSASGRTIVFQSWAENLDPADFNHNSDLFNVNLITANLSANPASATISWLISPGITYQVEYKDVLDAPTWQLLNQPIIITGQLANTIDPAPNAQQRWYRIVAQ